MKKLLIVLLALSVVGGVFAQEVSLSGGVRADMGASITSDDNDDTKDVTAWFWDPKGRDFKSGTGNDGTFIRVGAKGEGASGWVLIRTDGVWTAGGSVSIIEDTLGLGVGFNRLPFGYWSSFDLQGDGHYAFGASSISRTGYLQFNILKNFFVGIAEGGKVADKPIDADTFLPYIYLGYNHPTDDDSLFGFGLAFAGTNFNGKETGYTNDDGELVDSFSFMGKGYFNFLGIDNVTLGLNVAAYIAPDKTIFNVNGNPAAAGGGKDAFVLEGLLNAEIGIPDVCSIGLGVGVVVNLTDAEKGGGSFGLKAGLDANIPIAGGFSIIPGFAFTTYDLKTWNGSESVSAKGNVVDFGISFEYSF